MRAWLAFTCGAAFALGVAAAVVLTIGLATSERGEDAEAIADSFGVTIVWDTHLVPSCGAFGCHTPLTPDVIYIAPDLGTDTRRIVLHELAHVLQWRLGLPKDECDADRFAAALGEPWGSYCAPKDRL